MSERDHTTTDRRRDDPEEHYPTIDCRAIVETRENGPDECTIFPVDSEDPLGTTEWITAREGSYVPIEETN
ncbi:MAG: hypothetical protein QXG03_12725 [Halalkalicoccus sp.]